ncbi:MAG: GNAT family N-acetyltransferase [Planctomycetes bacterium]|nr:GNAT family N-acetyltransferase [Planctomycetota bacterium]MCB9869974.1 GNAT family N-acetyltransferase [Planctomycetota bacterium]
MPPLFASIELARRIEAAETRMVAQCVAAAQRSDPQSSVFLREFGGGIAAATFPGSPLNKVAGLGFEAVPDATAFAAVEAELLARCGAVQVELAHLAEPQLGAELTARGYRLCGYENVLGLRLPVDATPLAPGVAVRHAAADEAELWVQCVVDGFAVPDTQGIASHESFPRELVERACRDSAAAGLSLYVATRDSAWAGAASMRLDDGLAQLCGAATRLEHRRRGVQTALLARRLTEAAAAGCDLAVMTCLPGSKSHQNAQARGFELLYTRAVLVLEARC